MCLSQKGWLYASTFMMHEISAVCVRGQSWCNNDVRLAPCALVSNLPDRPASLSVCPSVFLLMHMHLSKSQARVFRVDVAGMEASSKQGHRLLVLGLGQGPLTPSSGCCGDTSLDILNRRRSESNVRLCVMVPGDASMWSLPDADALDHLRARLCSTLSLSGVCGPWEACQGSSTLGPATRHAHTHSHSAYGRQAGEQAVATDASSRVQVLALQCQDECQAARPCPEAQHPWLTHPWLKGLVLLRRRSPCALDLAPTGAAHTPRPRHWEL